MDQPQRKMPASLGGEISDEAMQMLKRSIFDGVPQPAIIAECIVRVLKRNDGRARSGLRGVISYYRQANRHGTLVKALEKVLAA